MSSNTYTRKTITGTTHHSRKGTQGRRKLPPGERKVKFSARVSELTKANVAEQARRYGMTQSAYADLALASYRIDVGQ